MSRKFPVQVYYCGGIDGGNKKTVNRCMVYDPKANKWLSSSSEPPAMPKGRNHAAACTDGTRMFVFGGRSGKNIVGQG
jgi:N-acetylneuraminic acid mutarotase